MRQFELMYSLGFKLGNDSFGWNRPNVLGNNGGSGGGFGVVESKCREGVLLDVVT